MKLKRILFISPIIASALFMTSCASYNASPLNDPTPDFLTAGQKKEIIAVSKAFDKNDCKVFLDRDVIAEGYQPIQLFFKNNSEKTYTFSLNRVSLPTQRPDVVAETVHTSTVGRAVGYGVGAIFIWPLAIPAIVDGIGSADANKALNSDFLAKAARDQTIFPHTKLNSIIFVPTDGYQNTFTVTLIDQETKEPKVINLVCEN